MPQLCLVSVPYPTRKPRLDQVPKFGAPNNQPVRQYTKPRKQYYNKFTTNISIHCSYPTTTCTVDEDSMPSDSFFTKETLIERTNDFVPLLLIDSCSYTNVAVPPQPIPTLITKRFSNQRTPRKHNPSNCIAIKPVGASVEYNACARHIEFGLKLLMSNTMSLAPKIDEIRCCVSNWKPDVACFTETWLHDAINDNHIHIPGYNFISKNRTTGSHGGVCLYIKNSMKFKSVADLQVHDIEVLWVWLRPRRLPRGTPCAIIGTIYHPPKADDKEMLAYLSTTLTTLEGLYPGCGTTL